MLNDQLLEIMDMKPIRKSHKEHIKTYSLFNNTMRSNNFHATFKTSFAPEISKNNFLLDLYMKIYNLELSQISLMQQMEQWILKNLS